MPEAALLDPANLTRPDTLNGQVPFAFLVARDQLPPQARAELERDFPKYAEAGFFPHDPRECGPSINALVDALLTPAFVDAVGARLGIDGLARYPAMVTLCRSVNKRHGTIHTDSRSKVVTALLYLNPAWPDTSDGCLRFLSRIDDIDATIAPEVKPLYGVLAAFKRADNSFHGYLPFEGERRIIQVAWLRNERELERKTRRGLATRFFKKLARGLDRKLGAGRDRSAAHPDGARM